MTILIEINFEAQVLGETQMAFQLLLRILCEANMRTSTAATLQCICIDLHLWPAAISLLRILCEANMRTSTAATLQCICIDLHLWPAAISVSGHGTTGS